MHSIERWRTPPGNGVSNGVRHEVHDNLTFVHSGLNSDCLRGQKTFFDDRDYQSFLEALSELKKEIPFLGEKKGSNLFCCVALSYGCSVRGRNSRGSYLRRDCGLYSQDGLTRGMKSAECGNWFETSRCKSLPPGVNDCAKAFQGSGSEQS